MADWHTEIRVSVAAKIMAELCGPGHEYRSWQDMARDAREAADALLAELGVTRATSTTGERQ